MKAFTLSVLSLLIIPVILTSCSNTPENMPPPLPVTPEVEEETDDVEQNFRGEIIEVEPGKDGSTVLLKSESGETVKATLSIPNLGPYSAFDFAAIETGNVIEVIGKTFKMNNATHLTASYAFVIYSEKEKNLCKNQGGQYEANGMLAAFNCNLPAADAGVACSNSDQCEGLCLQDGDSGVCSKDTVNFGCIPILEDGTKQTICID